GSRRATGNDDQHNVGSRGDRDFDVVITRLYWGAATIHQAAGERSTVLLDPRNGTSRPGEDRAANVTLGPAIAHEDIGILGWYHDHTETGAAQPAGADEVVAQRRDDVVGGRLGVHRDLHMPDCCEHGHDTLFSGKSS